MRRELAATVNRIGRIEAARDLAGDHTMFTDEYLTLKQRRTDLLKAIHDEANYWSRTQSAHRF
jgi:hypothetical protein